MTYDNLYLRPMQLTTSCAYDQYDLRPSTLVTDTIYDHLHLRPMRLAPSCTYDLCNLRSSALTIYATYDHLHLRPHNINVPFKILRVVIVRTPIKLIMFLEKLPISTPEHEWENKKNYSHLHFLHRKYIFIVPIWNFLSINFY